MKIGNKTIERTDKFTTPYIIAEIGVNYYEVAEYYDCALVEAAQSMIRQALKGGADAVKFQIYKADKLASKNAKAYWDLEKEPCENQFELFSKYDKLNYFDYDELRDYTESLGGTFLATLFDIDAVKEFGPILSAFKIASADITNYPLLEAIAKYKKPVLLSVGASTREEINKATDIFRYRYAYVLMHCILNYPTLPENANLQRIPTLRGWGNRLEGYSDHISPGATSDYENMLSLITAVFMGARIIEKHFTMNKELSGNDHYHSWTRCEIYKFKQQCAYIEKLLSKNEVNYLECESEARIHARRSIVAKTFIKKGEILTDENCIMKRPGTGISPIQWSLIRDTQYALRDIEEDEIIDGKSIADLHTKCA